ncbi:MULTISPECIES: YesL family protein [Gracilibacillus]|uniref:YesL family protein n=1 Tax=Gracilibacillus TaxID=74385 RepID=UPI000826BCB9|nr:MULTISPECIES: DUF624 domain-containing protein [Gracilibacillus]
MRAVHTALEWIMKVAYLNILWLAFSLLGFVVMGLFPATAATFAVVRKWFTGGVDQPIFKTFWLAYKQSLLQANILGYIMVTLYYILYLDFVFLTLIDNEPMLLLTIPFFLILVVTGLTSLYIFPMYVHFDMKTIEVLKASFFMMLLHPFQTMTMALGVFALWFGLWHFQWLFLFFSMSVLAIILVMPALKASNKIAERYQQKLLLEK